MQALIIKQWCDENITPVAWQRVTMKIFAHFREKGLSLTDLENPSAAIVLAPDSVEIIKQTISEMYQIEVSVLA